MRTKLIFIILLSLIASKNEELTKNIDNNKILNKKRTLQKFIVPSDIQKHSDWKTLKMLHDIEIRELRENIKKVDRKVYRKKFLDLKKKQKEQEYKLYQKLNQ